MQEILIPVGHKKGVRVDLEKMCEDWIFCFTDDFGIELREEIARVERLYSEITL